MPKYTQYCRSCDSKVQVLCDINDLVLCKKCGTQTERQLPIVGQTKVTENVDSFLGTHWVQDQTEILRERKANYFWEVEVPRFVNSGVYTLETMLENQWVYYDEKGNLQTRTFPPQKQ